jgi:hypothetical protein
LPPPGIHRARGLSAPVFNGGVAGARRASGLVFSYLHPRLRVFMRTIDDAHATFGGF